MVDASGYSYDQAISDEHGNSISMQIGKQGAMFLSQISHPPSVCDSVILLIRALRKREKRGRDR